MALNAPANGPGTGPVLAMHFRKADTSLRLFTTIATLGTPQDVTLQELRIECFFPADEETATILRGWAGAPEDGAITRTPARAREPASPPSTS